MEEGGERRGREEGEGRMGEGGETREDGDYHTTAILQAGAENWVCVLNNNISLPSLRYHQSCCVGRERWHTHTHLQGLRYFRVLNLIRLSK